MFPVKMLKDISEMFAIQPCESKVHVTLLGGEDWLSFFRRGLFLHTAGHVFLQETQALKSLFL